MFSIVAVFNIYVCFCVGKGDSDDVISEKLKLYFLSSDYLS